MFPNSMTTTSSSSTSSIDSHKNDNLSDDGDEEQQVDVIEIIQTTHHSRHSSLSSIGESLDCPQSPPPPCDFSLTILATSSPEIQRLFKQQDETASTFFSLEDIPLDNLSIWSASEQLRSHRRRSCDTLPDPTLLSEKSHRRNTQVVLRP